MSDYAGIAGERQFQEAVVSLGGRQVIDRRLVSLDDLYGPKGVSIEGGGSENQRGPWAVM